MSASSTRLPTPSLRLRLFSHDESSSEATSSGGGRELSPDSTLEEFVEAWFKPITVRTRKLAGSTVEGYDEAVTWWTRLSGSPPLSQIDAFTVLDFAEALDCATFHRDYHHRQRPIRAKARPLSLRRKFNIKTRLNTIFRVVGPTVDPEEPHANLLDRVPLIPTRADRRQLKAEGEEPKLPFTFAQAQRIVAQCDLLKAPCLANISAGDWWRAFLATMFYTGLRLSEVGRLKYSMLIQQGGSWWLDLPANITKARRREKLVVHPQLLQLLQKIEANRAQIFMWPHCEKHLANCHKRLQQLAGIAEAEQLGFHAWRRTFGSQMEQLGADAGMKAAQSSLRHQDESTTRTSYVNNAARLMRRLPVLVPEQAGDRQPLLFD